MHDSYIRRNRSSSMRKRHRFKTGDGVWLHRVFPSTRVAGVNKSFYWPFRPEPFEITERLSSQHVRIRRKATPANPQPGRPQIVHTRRLKPYRPQADAFDYSDLSIQTS